MGEIKKKIVFEFSDIVSVLFEYLLFIYLWFFFIYILRKNLRLKTGCLQPIEKRERPNSKSQRYLTSLGGNLGNLTFSLLWLKNVGTFDTKSGNLTTRSLLKFYATEVAASWSNDVFRFEIWDKSFFRSEALVWKVSDTALRFFIYCSGKSGKIRKVGI